MLLEFNEVLIEGERHTMSFTAGNGEVVCLTGGDDNRRACWTDAILGFTPVRHGYISIDGEPLTIQSAPVFRRMMAYVPSTLKTIGEVRVYEPPTVQDVFALKANRDLPISNGILGEEMRKVGTDMGDQQTQLMAVGALLNKTILLIDSPAAAAMDYLRLLGSKGKLILIMSNNPEVASQCDHIIDF